MLFLLCVINSNYLHNYVLAFYYYYYKPSMIYLHCSPNYCVLKKVATIRSLSALPPFSSGPTAMGGARWGRAGISQSSAWSKAMLCNMHAARKTSHAFVGFSRTSPWRIPKRLFKTPKAHSTFTLVWVWAKL